MREIKFRVWDKKNNKMIYDSDINKTEYCLVLTLDGKIYDNAYDRFDKEITKSFILEQYTGLKDKNGKDIYEGDFVRISKPFKSYNKTGFIVYCEKEMKYKIAIDDSNMYKQKYIYKSYNPIKTRLKIVGNIHQDESEEA